jgi:MoaA/NifB/PqqE/SkfB family radical SAM enzyme
MTQLGVPAMPASPQQHRPSGSVGFTTGHHFAAVEGASVDDLADAATKPLSVILQVTKRCNFDCSFCSETMQLPDPTLDQLDTIRANLAGVARVFLSGGEPLLRQDFGEIVDMYTGDFILGIPTNATRGLRHAAAMVGKVAFVNVGLEGPRATTNRVRGDYDEVMAGVRAFMDHGLPLSLSAVVYRSTLLALPFTYQIADVIGAGKLKLILPLRKGNALDLAEHEFISLDEAGQAFDRLTEARAVHDWRPALRMTTWTPETEGHMILVEVTGKASAWPVYDAPDLLEPLGNLLEEPVSEIWTRYRFKRNHFAKYLGRSIRTVANAGAAAGTGGYARA